MDLINRLVAIGYDLTTAIDIFYKHVSLDCLLELDEEIREREKELKDGISEF